MNGSDTVTALLQSPGLGVVAPDTTIEEEAVKPPSAVLAVITADPCVSPVTSPVLLTEAMAGEPELQVTLLLLAVAGVTVAVSCNVSFIAIESEAVVTLTPVTGTFTPGVGVLPYTSALSTYSGMVVTSFRAPSTPCDDQSFAGFQAEALAS